MGVDCVCWKAEREKGNETNKCKEASSSTPGPQEGSPEAWELKETTSLREGHVVRPKKAGQGSLWVLGHFCVWDCLYMLALFLAFSWRAPEALAWLASSALHNADKPPPPSRRAFFIALISLRDIDRCQQRHLL